MKTPTSALGAAFRAAGVPVQALPDGGETPLRFGSSVSEHHATRHACGLFDFSFMGGWEFTGPQALAHLTRLQTRDLNHLAPGQIAYTLMCRDDGSVFNDATVWKFSAQHYWLFSGRKSDGQSIGQDHKRIDRTHAVLALQGPNSARLLATLIGEETMRQLGYFRFAASMLCGHACHIGRIGYSGELGYELIVPADAAPMIWQTLLEAGQRFGIHPCGFEAANMLRIESGYILFSNELAHARLPVELGLEKLVTSTASELRGHAALRAPADRGHSKLVCVELSEPGLNSTSASPLAIELTSSAFSPLIGRHLGLGFTSVKNSAPRTRLICADGREAAVCRRPYYDSRRLRPRAQPLMQPLKQAPN